MKIKSLIYILIHSLIISFILFFMLGSPWVLLINIIPFVLMIGGKRYV